MAPSARAPAILGQPRKPGQTAEAPHQDDAATASRSSEDGPNRTHERRHPAMPSSRSGGGSHRESSHADPNRGRRRMATTMMVGLGRLELPTSRLSSARSNQLSYKPNARTSKSLARQTPARHAETPKGSPGPQARAERTGSSRKKEKRRRRQAPHTRP